MSSRSTGNRGTETEGTLTYKAGEKYPWEGLRLEEEPLEGKMRDTQKSRNIM